MGSILVTGALGNVGGYVARFLIQKGEPVVLADINPEALRTKYGAGVRCVPFDFTDKATFGNALRGVDRVFLMRPPHLGKPKDLKPFIEALKDQEGMKMVSFLSLMGVENNPVPPHHRIEKYIERAGLPFCHIRPSFFMQNLSGVHAFEIKHFNRIVVPVGQALTSFIDAQDIAEVVAKVLCEPETHGNRGYSITGPQAIGYEEVARIFSEELGRQIVYANPMPMLASRYWVGVRGMENGYASVMGMLYLMTRMGAARTVTSTFEDIMGKKPQAFREFVRKNRAAWSNG